jgi:ferredoxin-NADP reductase
MKYALANRQKLTDKIMLITLAPLGADRIMFHPGQYAALRFWRFGRPSPARCFSIVNARSGNGELQFAIRTRGKYTNALAKLPISSEIHVDGPFGDFVYDADFDRHSVLIAGGIGITPMMSIIRDSLIQGYGNTMTLLYSVQNESDAIFADELIQLSTKFPNFKVIFSVTRGQIAKFNSNQSIEGRISQELISRATHNDFHNTSFFICGPVGFLNDMKSYLRDRQTPAIRINTEAFTQSQADRDTVGALQSGLKASSIYSLAAIAFVIVLSTIIMTDISSHTTSLKKVATPTSSQATASTTSDDSSSGNYVNNPPTSTNQSYQQPVTTVS